MTITKEDFEAWLAHPVTETFFIRIGTIIEDARENWNNASWNNEGLWSDGKASDLRIACKSRAECAEDILAITFEEEAEES